MAKTLRPKPRQRKTDTVAERVTSRAIVAKTRDPRQLELFDEPMPSWVEYVVSLTAGVFSL